MLKSLIVLPMLLIGLLTLCVGGGLVLPLLALVPALFVVVVSLAVVALIVRVLAAVLIGVGGLMVGVFGFAFLIIVGGALLLALGAALAHLLLPLLLIFGLVWLIRRSTKPAVPVLPTA